MSERIGEMARFNSLYQVETSTHVVQLSEHLHRVEWGCQVSGGWRGAVRAVRPSEAAMIITLTCLLADFGNSCRFVLLNTVTCS